MASNPVMRYNKATDKHIVSPQNVEDFLEAYKHLCEKHGLAIGEDDENGLLVVYSLDYPLEYLIHDAFLDLEELNK